MGQICYTQRLNIDMENVKRCCFLGKSFVVFRLYIYIWLRHGTLNLLEGQWDGLFATCQALVIHQASNISDTGFQNRVFQLVVVVVFRFLSIVTIFHVTCVLIVFFHFSSVHFPLALFSQVFLFVLFCSCFLSLLLQLWLLLLLLFVAVVCCC